MVRVAIAVCVAALVCAGSSAAARPTAPTTQDVTITGSGGVQLACQFFLPSGAAPDGGWPGLVLFPALGNAPTDGTDFASAGFASVACDERGTGSSGGSFDLAGPNDAADAQAIFDWLAARPEVSDTQIGAYGFDLGGAEVWNAAVAGVPFKAIVPADGWSSLDRLLHPGDWTDVEMLSNLTSAGSSSWDTPSGIAARSYRAGIQSLTVPTLMVYARATVYGDLRQATVPYRLLGGPKRLFVASNATPFSTSPEVLAWFREYLAGGPKVGSGVEIQNEYPDPTTTVFPTIPPTRSVSVNLPGTALTRHVWLPGTLETFGGGSVTVRYSHASWTQVVAEVVENGNLVTEGAVPVTQTAGVLKIPLLNYMRFLPHHTKLSVMLLSHGLRFGGSPGGSIDIGRVTLKLSVLQRAVSN